MFALLASAFATGLLGSAHCIGMCGGFAGACAAQHGLTGSALYSLGRLVTYSLLGALAGAFGWALGGLSVVGIIVAAVFLVYFSARLAGLLPGLSVRVPRLSALVRRVGVAKWWGARLLFGAATALIPCGLVYAALALPIASGSPSQGALVMIAFGLGTTPAMLAVGLGVSWLGRAGRGMRRALAVAVLIAGSAALFTRFPAATEGDEPPPCHQHDTSQPGQHAPADHAH